jgi:molybdopterin molybdotransferase
MDGYAFDGNLLNQHPEEIITLEVAGKVFAGDKINEDILLFKKTIQVTTGSIMPLNSNTVIPQEFVELVKGKIKFLKNAVKNGDNCRLKGEDLNSGYPALKKGRTLKPSDLGLIASLGIAEINVYRKMRVAFFSTGDELRSLGESLDEGCVYDSNRYTLFGMLTRLGVDILDLGVIPDNKDKLESTFISASKNADLIITTGGVSVGEADYTKEIMKRLGDVEFWKIAMRPGRPMAFGQILNQNSNTLLFGLPGNPVAVMVTFYVFVRQTIKLMSGSLNEEYKYQFVTLSEKIRKKPGRTEYRRARLNYINGEMRATLTGSQGSGILRSMSEADCLLILEHDAEELKIGSTVPAFIFNGLV